MEGQLTSHQNSYDMGVQISKVLKGLGLVRVHCTADCSKLASVENLQAVSTDHSVCLFQMASLLQSAVPLSQTP